MSPPLLESSQITLGEKNTHLHLVGLQLKHCLVLIVVVKKAVLLGDLHMWWDGTTSVRALVGDG